MRAVLRLGWRVLSTLYWICISAGVSIWRVDGNDLVYLARVHALTVGGRGRFRGDFIDTAGLDAEAIKLRPEGRYGLASVSVEVSTTDADELPSGAFEVALTCHVLLVTLGTVPLVAVALDG
jgi:hypothetical protein